jgi:hypothetical protein
MMPRTVRLEQWVRMPELQASHWPQPVTHVAFCDFEVGVADSGKLHAYERFAGLSLRGRVVAGQLQIPVKKYRSHLRGLHVGRNISGTER